MRIAQILARLRSDSLSPVERGRRFEWIMRTWLLAVPVMASELEQVWLWEQFGLHDLGIDLVARARLGEYWAVQCKFYA